MRRGPLLALSGMSLCLCLATSAVAAAEASATLSTPRPYLYVGEQTTLELKLTTRGCEVSGLSLDGMPPEELYEVVSPLSARPIIRTQKGRILTEVRPFQGQILGLKPGKVRMAPTLAAQLTETRNNGPFTSRQTYTRRIPIAPCNFEVRPLPPPAAGTTFSGGVGAFDVSVTLSSTNVAVGDLITVRTEIRGDGGCTRLELPDVAPGPHFRVYPAKTIQEEETILVREQVVVPQSEQAPTFAPVQITWFDTREEQYVTRTFGPYALTFHAPETIDAGTYRPAQTSETNAAAILLDEHAGTMGGDALLSETTARLAPAHTAAELFIVPKGARVQPIREYRGWVTIEYAGRRGWIPLTEPTTTP